MAEFLSDCIKPNPVGGRKTKASEIIGIEVELEHCILKTAIPYWKNTADLSLKHKGKEFTICCHSNQALKVLTELKNAVYYKNTPRTSVHVHLNVQDMPLENFHTLIAVYMLFEKGLYKYSGYRWDNIFCVPLNTFLRQPIFNWEYNKLKGFWSESEFKYSGLNLGRLKDLGTVEFRQMRGNLNVLYINDWIDIIIHIKKFAMQHPMSEFKVILETLNNTSSYWWLLSEVFGKHASALNYAEFADDIEDACVNVKYLMYKQELFNVNLSLGVK